MEHWSWSCLIVGGPVASQRWRSCSASGCGPGFYPDTPVHAPGKEQEERTTNPMPFCFVRQNHTDRLQNVFSPQKCKYDRCGLDWTLFFSLRTEEHSGWPRRTISSKGSSKLEDFDEAKTTCVCFGTVGGANYPPASHHPFPKLVSQFELPRAGSVWLYELRQRCCWVTPASGMVLSNAKYNVISLICMIPARRVSFYMEETKKQCDLAGNICSPAGTCIDWMLRICLTNIYMITGVFRWL
jgi:hypothetical protein